MAIAAAPILPAWDLEQIQAHVMAGLPMLALFGVEVIHADPASAVIKLRDGPHITRPGGSVAGPVLFAMADQGRLGKKASAGFYAYGADGRRTGLWEGLAAQYPVADVQPELTEVQHRLLMAQALEAVRALEEGVLMDIREGDVGAILGWGFAPWSGGPFSWLDIIGAPRAVAICDALAAAHGARFTAPALLREMAGKAQTFYGRFAAAVKAA